MLFFAEGCSPIIIAVVDYDVNLTEYFISVSHRNKRNERMNDNDNNCRMMMMKWRVSTPRFISQKKKNVYNTKNLYSCAKQNNNNNPVTRQ